MQTARIINVSKGTVVAEQAELAVTFFTRLQGLLGRKELPEKHGLILRPTDQIHTFFMAFPIDVLFLDSSNHVVRMIGNMGPGRISPFMRHVKSVVELPVGTIAGSAITPGDELRIE
jgi:uncharacterized protein